MQVIARSELDDRFDRLVAMLEEAGVLHGDIAELANEIACIQNIEAYEAYTEQEIVDRLEVYAANSEAFWRDYIDECRQKGDSEECVRYLEHAAHSRVDAVRNLTAQPRLWLRPSLRTEPRTRCHCGGAVTTIRGLTFCLACDSALIARLLGKAQGPANPSTEEAHAAC